LGIDAPQKVRPLHDRLGRKLFNGATRVSQIGAYTGIRKSELTTARKQIEDLIGLQDYRKV
jgi:hypothetical protein